MEQHNVGQQVKPSAMRLATELSARLSADLDQQTIISMQLDMQCKAYSAEINELKDRISAYESLGNKE